MKTLHKMGPLGLNTANGTLSHDSVARCITEDAKRDQSAARTLAVVAGIVHGVDGFWRNLKLGGKVISERDAEFTARNHVSLAAYLVSVARLDSGAESAEIASALSSEDSATLVLGRAEWERDSGKDDSEGVDMRLHWALGDSKLTLAQWFDAMEFLIGRGYAGPVLSPMPVAASHARLVCRNTGADDRPVRWDYTGEQ